MTHESMHRLVDEVSAGPGTVLGATALRRIAMVCIRGIAHSGDRTAAGEIRELRWHLENAEHRTRQDRRRGARGDHDL